MAIGDIFKNKEDQNIEHFWSLVIGKNWVQAGIWRVIDATAQVVSNGNMASWQEGDIDSLVTASDSTLSAAATSMGSDVPEPDKVVFGLHSSWVEEGSIKSERMDILKKISKELELSPSGFVVIPEAITHLMKVREGAPLNAILVGLAEISVDISIAQSGKVLGTSEVSRSMSLGADVAEGLSRLPALSQSTNRILLYDHKAGNLDEARQSLLKTEWNSVKVNFLHTPKVEVLSENTAVLAVSLAGGAEVGGATNVTFGSVETAAVEDKEEENGPIDTREVIETPLNTPEIPSLARNLGFSENDAAKQNLPEVNNIEEQVADADLEETPIIPEAIQRQVSSEAITRPKTSLFGKLGSAVGMAGSVFSNISLPVPRVSGKGKGIALLALLFGLLIIGGVAYWYIPKAQVTVYIAPKKLDREMEFSVNLSVTVVDLSGKIIPGRELPQKVNGDKTASTTGTKTVGDRAKGRVKILHVGGASTLKKGTLLAGPNNLKFTLDEEVKVASGSGISTPSETVVPVSALDIGAQYNLASAAKFGVGSFSRDTYEATNTEAFTGGTSRSVSSVSEVDQTDLLKDLTDEVLARGVQKAKESLSEDQLLIEESAQFTATKKDFSHKIGEETQTVKLALDGEVRVLILQRDFLNMLVHSEIEKDVPSGYTLRPDQLEFSFKQKPQEIKVATSSKTKTNEAVQRALNFTASIRANLLPKTDPDEIRRNIAGKSTDAAKKEMSMIPGYTRADIRYSPTFTRSLGTLPRMSKNIVIEISAER